MAERGMLKGLKRGQLARQTDCNLETIRYYEKIGLLAESPRDTNGYHVYDETHVSRLRFVLRGRDLGFTIEQIRGLLELVDGGAQTCAEVKARTDEHLTDVRAKIADLHRIETILVKTVAQCAGDEAPECPILDALKL